MLEQLAKFRFIALCAIAEFAIGQTPNYDEARVPRYELPDPLVTTAGDHIRSPHEWRENRRDELVDLFEQHVYGKMPPAVPLDHVTLVEVDASALDGEAIRRQVNLYFDASESIPPIRLLIYMPTSASQQPVPAFIGLNFGGNHTIRDDAAIQLNKTWNRDGELGMPDESTRGTAASRWPVNDIIARGYAVVTAHYADIDPDFDDGFQNGVHQVFPEYQDRDDNWSSIGAWAWGLSRMLDYVETVPEIDSTRVAVVGHSRLGKTALWAGAYDERFAMVVSNNSGCGGAALARRGIGETVEAINRRFPHWFCKQHKKYNDKEDTLPVDQHQLLALVAPRPLYVASATEDLWADPRGEFLSCVAASEVYELLTGQGLPTDTWPQPEQPVHGRISYHLRSGKHDITKYDWQQYLTVADRYLKPNHATRTESPQP